MSRCVSLSSSSMSTPSSSFRLTNTQCDKTRYFNRNVNVYEYKYINASLPIIHSHTFISIRYREYGPWCVLARARDINRWKKQRYQFDSVRLLFGRMNWIFDWFIMVESLFHSLRFNGTFSVSHSYAFSLSLSPLHTHSLALFLLCVALLFMSNFYIASCLLRWIYIYTCIRTIWHQIHI